MKLSRVFFVTMAFFLVLSGLLAINRKVHLLMADGQGKLRQQIEQIDEEIAELKTMKRGYESKAIRHENLAEMMQFESEYTLEIRQQYKLADQNRAIANRIQQDIDRLEAKKQALLK